MRNPLPLLAVALAGLSATAALAQGTAAQREACTPDAIRLCPDTIPDVAKTTTCMKAHVAELGPACRAVVVSAAPTPPPAAQAVAPAVAPAAPAAIGEVDPPRARRARGRLFDDPDAEIAYVPPRRVIAPPVYSQPGRVIFPAQPYADGTFCSPPYDFCEPTYVDPNDPQ